MPPEPAIKRAVAFVDGQNLFHAAREAFGCTFPNYHASKLAGAVCKAGGWELTQVRFYTGVPDPTHDPWWSHFWAAKGAAMGREGVVVFTRRLRYRNRTVRLPGGRTHTLLAGEEKGIDVRIALDIVRLARLGEYDVALIFSQDQDLSEAAAEIRLIAREHRRWIKAACAYPVSPASRNKRGIDKTDWFKIDRRTYDACLDLRDYRPTR